MEVEVEVSSNEEGDFTDLVRALFLKHKFKQNLNTLVEFNTYIPAFASDSHLLLQDSNAVTSQMNKYWYTSFLLSVLGEYV
jgi:hypothetical protein